MGTSLLSKPEETLLRIVNRVNDMVAELDKGDSAKEQIKSKFSVLAKERFVLQHLL